MNKLTDKDLREALRRREARRAETEVPADFCDNIMREITPKPARRKRNAYIATLAAAACIVFAVLMVWPTDGEQKYDWSGLTVRHERTHSPTGADSQSEAIELAACPKPAIKKHPSKKQMPQQILAKTTDVDSLDYYINKIERELANMDDSLYIERIHRVMHADERLQRIVNNYIVNELHKDVKSNEANNINNVKTDEDEE